VKWGLIILNFELIAVGFNQRIKGLNKLGALAQKQIQLMGLKPKVRECLFIRRLKPTAIIS
jgi:hypothetical protein